MIAIARSKVLVMPAAPYACFLFPFRPRYVPFSLFVLVGTTPERISTHTFASIRSNRYTITIAEFIGYLYAPQSRSNAIAIAVLALYASVGHWPFYDNGMEVEKENGSHD